MNKDKKILIVDDQEITVKLAEHILSTEYTTICATSGEEAIALYEKEHPDLVLSDLRMPGMSGFELQLILQGQYHEQIPFIFMTADSDDEVESIGFKNGAMDFIRKPFRPDVLLKRIGNILDTIEKIYGLKKAAVTDTMTGLLNKASSETEISALCKDTQGVLMVIDLDSFKLVNDLYGHSMGDRILIDFADIIRSAVRSTDIVGRIGGDEFIAYCQHIADEGVIRDKADYINKSIVAAAKKILGSDMTIPLGASLGCVFAPAEGTDYSLLFQKADRALYEVKQNGKHGYRVYKDTSDQDSGEEQRSSYLSDTVTILEERNRTRGAMRLSFEAFRTTYRFLGRTVANYHRLAWLLLFRLEAKGTPHTSEADATEALLDVLCASLRLSDAVTTSGSNQCLVLLLEAQHASIHIVITRIMKRWNSTETSGEYSISYEIGQIE